MNDRTPILVAEDEAMLQPSQETSPAAPISAAPFGAGAGPPAVRPLAGLWEERCDGQKRASAAVLRE